MKIVTCIDLKRKFELKSVKEHGYCFQLQNGSKRSH